MSRQAESRDWFFWFAAVASLLVLAALSAAAIIGFRAALRTGGEAWVNIVLYLSVGLLFWLLATLIALVKPGETMIRAGYFAAIGTALQFCARSFDPLLESLSPSQFVFSRLLFLTSPLHLAYAVEFFYRFPEGPIPGRLWRNLRVGLYAFALSVWMIRLPRVWAWALKHEGFNESWVWPLEESALVFLATAIAAAIFVNYRRVPRPGQRRRLYWVVLAAAATAIPQVLLGAANALGGNFGLDHPLTLAVELSAVLLPLTMIYAILRHRTLGLQLVLRQSVQYLLAKSILQILIALPVVLLAIQLYLHVNDSLSQLLTQHPFPIVLIAGAILGSYRRERLLDWIDRRFFREAHHREQLLAQLADKMHAIDSLDDLPQLIVSTVEQALHPSRVAMFLRDRGGNHFVRVGRGVDDSGASSLPDSLPVVELLNRSKSIEFSSSLPPDVAGWMSQQQAVLAVPLLGAGRLAGILLLGEKRSEEPYTAKDRLLLNSVSSQAAVLFENEWLKTRLNQEQRVQKDVLARIEASEFNLLKECPRCGRCYDATTQACSLDNAELTLTIPVDRLIAERYRLDRRLGQGGMGAVYSAHDLRLDRTVAVKVMTGALFGNRAAMRRFDREARLAARLSHRNIVAVYDYGTTGLDGAYLVMELVSGETWRSALHRVGAFSPVLAAKRMNELMEGVKVAHDSAMVHRDLKPENVMIADSDEIKILDFGLATMVRDTPETSQLTVPGTVLGTAAYMSYEQLCGEIADERSDIFALGVMACEALTGHRPFDGRTSAELASAIANRRWRLPVDSVLSAVLARCLAWQAKDRYATVAELQRELIPAIAASPPAAASRGDGNEAPTMTVS